MTDTRTALVIGGGIAGPVTAMALQKAGIEATVYEAYTATADGIGGGLSIAPNGLAALGVIGADDLVRKVGAPVAALVMESWTGRRLAELGSLPGQPAMQFVWRTDLYRVLHDEATRRGIRTEYGKRLVDARNTGKGAIARFADGSEATADILIGADGIRSTTRTLIDPGAPRPRYSGLISFGARLADTGLPSTGGKMHMVFGKRAFFGYSSDDDGSGGWFVNLPRREAVPLEQVRATGADRWLDLLREASAQDRTPVPHLLDRTDPADLLIVGPMEDLPNVPRWSAGRLVLVGDSAHAPSASSGQGASMAVESAVQLARCLRDLPYERAFAAYEGLRRSRVERTIAAGARANQDKAAGPVARVLRDLLLPVAMKLLAKPGKMAWQFGYRIDWDAPVVDPAPGAARQAVAAS